MTGGGPVNTKQLVKQKSIRTHGRGSIRMRNELGPSRYGYPNLQNDPRAKISDLEDLFDVIDLNKSETVTLDEMQWFLELQGTAIKRSEFQQIVEKIGVEGPNAPLDRDKFVHFLLYILNENSKATFEVREVKATPVPPQRIQDSKILKKILVEDAEAKKLRNSQPPPRAKPYNGGGGGGGRIGGGMKTELCFKSWQELEALRQSLPDPFALEVSQISDYDPNAVKNPPSTQKKKKKNRNGNKNRPVSAPAGRGSRANSKGNESDSDEFSPQFYERAPDYQGSICGREALEVREGVTIKEQVADRPQTATERSGGDWPYDPEHLTKKQFEQMKNPELYAEEEDEELGSLHHSSKSSFKPVTATGNVTVSPHASVELSGTSEHDDLISLKDGRRSESPSANLPLGGSPNSHGHTPHSIRTSPVLLRRFDAENKKNQALQNAANSKIKALEEAENNLKEIPTGTIKPPVLGLLPPARARKNRAEIKKLASNFALRSRPKSATGQINSSWTSQRLERAREFNNELINNRPSTSGGLGSGGSTRGGRGASESAFGNRPSTSGGGRRHQ